MASVNNFAAQSNLLIYTRPGWSGSLFEEILSVNFNQFLTEHNLFFDRVEALSFQSGASKRAGMISNDIYLRIGQPVRQKPHTVWELGLDTLISVKPALVRNHTQGQKVILIQDRAGKVMMINYAGRILWELQINEPLISDIYQLDIQRNGQVQYLFNTKSKLFLIDVDGNHLPRFPIILNAQATAGVGLADYNGKGEYRFFIPCSDRKVYVYGSDGNIIKGWEFGKTEAEVTQPVQHFNAKGRDFIVFSDKNRAYFLDRKGKPRISFKTEFKPSLNCQFEAEALQDPVKARLIGTDLSGTPYFFYLSGKFEKGAIQSMPENHFFYFRDFDGDGLRDYIYATEQEVIVFRNDMKTILNYQPGYRITDKPVFFDFPGKVKKLGLTAGDENQIFLLNPDGSLDQGFPLPGNTRFSIGSIGANKRFNLFVGTRDNFLYNYEIKQESVRN
jgi:hypothetical protein